MNETSSPLASLGTGHGEYLLSRDVHVVHITSMTLSLCYQLIVVRSAEVVIAVGGEYGTLSEIAFALKMGKPVIGLATWELSREGMPDPIIRAESPVEAVARALALARGQPPI